MVNLLTRVKKAIQTRTENIAERSRVNNEARQAADIAYKETYRKEKISVEKRRARSRARRDARQQGGGLTGALNRVGANADKLLNADMDFDVPSLDLGLGTKKSRKRKKEIWEL